MSSPAVVMPAPTVEEAHLTARQAVYARACDACRLRKIKCDTLRPCRSCETRGFDCTEVQPQKRRGRIPKRILQVLERQQKRSSEPTAHGLDEAQLRSPVQSVSEECSIDRRSASSMNGDLGVDETSSYATVQDESSPNMNSAIGSRPLVESRDGLGQYEQRAGFSTLPFYFEEEPVMLPSWTWNIASGMFQTQVQEDFFAANGASDGNFSVTAQERAPAPAPFRHQQQEEQGRIVSPSSIPHLAQSQDSRAQPVQESTPTDSGQQQYEIAGSWPENVGEDIILPLIDVFFDRLHATLPVLDRSSVYKDLIQGRHRREKQFGAMILSLCAFSLIQPCQAEERFSTTSRDLQATTLLNEASRMHYTSEFGENPNLEAVLTGLFMHGCHFGRHQLNAAWIKLREAVSLAIILGLQNSESYKSFSVGQRNRRLRIYFLLCVTERTFAMVCRRNIEFKGRPGLLMQSMYNPQEFMDDTNGIMIHHQRDIKAMIGLQQMIAVIDDIDELFIQCANGSCGPGHRFDSSQALLLHQRWSQTDPMTKVSRSGHLQDSQQVDIDILRYWIINRLWNVCLAHSILSTTSPYPPLRIQYAINIAQSTLQICSLYGIENLEIHGIGMIVRLYDIATTVITVRELLLGSVQRLENKEGDASVWQTDISNREVVNSELVAVSRVLNEFMDLMSKFRGGNHIYLELFKKRL